MTTFLNVYYDLRYAPITFDFGSYLVVANAERQARCLDGLAIYLHKSDYRNLTPRDQSYSRDTKDWRFKHILLPLTNLLPDIIKVSWSALPPKDIAEPRFPPSYPPRTPASSASGCIPYLSSALAKYANRGLNLRPYRATPEALRIVDGMLGDVVNRRRLVTITLRTSTQQKQRNSDLDSWFTVYSRLRDEGFDVLVVPDFEDLASLRSYAKYPWALFLPAALDLEIRLALYSRSIQNLGVLNGVLVPLFHSNLPYLIFKPNVESVPVTSRKWLKDVFGIEHGDNFWWAGASQELAWDSDHDSNKILERFFRVIGATS